MEGLKAFEMRPVARPVNVEERHDKTWTVGVTADAARRLDILRSRLWLPQHDHQPETRDIEAH